MLISHFLLVVFGIYLPPPPPIWLATELLIGCRICPHFLLVVFGDLPHPPYLASNGAFDWLLDLFLFLIGCLQDLSLLLVGWLWWILQLWSWRLTRWCEYEIPYTSKAKSLISSTSVNSNYSRIKRTISRLFIYLNKSTWSPYKKVLNKRKYQQQQNSKIQASCIYYLGLIIHKFRFRKYSTV